MVFREMYNRLYIYYHFEIGRRDNLFHWSFSITILAFFFLMLFYKMGRIGKRLGSAVGGILGSEAAKSKVGRRLIGMGIGNKKLATSTGQMAGAKLGSLLPFKNGGVAVVVKAPRKKRKTKK